MIINPNQELFTSAEVCKIFDISDNTLRTRRNKGWISPIDTCGGPAQYPREEIERLKKPIQKTQKAA